MHTPSSPCDPPPLSPPRLDRPVIFSLSSPSQTQTCPLLSCFQLNFVLSGILGHIVLRLPERKMTACEGNSHCSASQTWPEISWWGWSTKAGGDPRADVVDQRGLQWVWGGVYFLVLSFHSCCSLETPAFQFPGLILIFWDWLVLSDPYPCLSSWLHVFIPALWLTQPPHTHNPHSHTHSNSCDSLNRE